ncbi:MAG TPA: helix-turn-helix transcriptional regulator [Acidimicrobiales bacterium]|nr:helix-turn-helix transcriptional regulator [Acidimicrobiales bacterium]
MSSPTESGSDRPQFAQLLRESRRQLNLTGHEVAQQLQVADSTLRNAEAGRATPGLFKNLHDVFPDNADAIITAWEVHRAAVSPSDNDMFKRRRADRKLEGTWHALWQTSVGGLSNYNTEVIHAHWVSDSILAIRNVEPSKENPEGGYLWKSELHFYDNCNLMGVYLPLDDVTLSKGTIFGLLHRSGRYVRGIWTGCNYDSELTSGRFVLSRSPEAVWELLAAELGVDVSVLKEPL